MKRPYCCDASAGMYEQYYANQQSGRGMPVYSGALRQRGHGLGNIIGSLFRRILPFLGRGAAAALMTGSKVVGDVSEGKKFKQSLKDRVPEGIKSLASSLVNQSGSGHRKRKRRQSKNKKKKKKPKKTKKIKRYCDKFDL